MAVVAEAIDLLRVHFKCRRLIDSATKTLMEWYACCEGILTWQDQAFQSGYGPFL